MTTSAQLRLNKKSEWGFVGSEENRIYGSSVRHETLYKDFWGSNKWYDKVTNEGTAKVCSESFFCYSKKGSLNWSYEKGLIINSTICYDKNKIYFIEFHNKELQTQHNSRISSTKMWDSQTMVCLDAITGEVLWSHPIDTSDGDVVFYMQVSPLGILVTASNSTSKNFHLHGFDLKGKPKWTNNHTWPGKDHAAHMQHPVILDDKIFLEPYSYNRNTGESLFKGIGKREGCHTYVGIKKGLVFRGESRQISMWSLKDKKTTSWTRLRPSCWLSMIPATGMLLVPEGGGGCSCGGWMETSLGFSPWEVQ